MDDELTPEQKFAAEDPETMVPRALMQGRCREDLVAELVRLDWSPAEAEALLNRVLEDLGRFAESPEARRRLVQEARKQFIGGIILTLIGAGVIPILFVAAVSGILPFFLGGLGVFFAGLALASRGWTRWRLYGREQLPFEVIPPAEGDEA